MKTALLRPEFGGRREPTHALAEATALGSALGLKIAFQASLRVRNRGAPSLFGAGQCAEIGRRLTDQCIESVIVDGDMSAAQQSSLEALWRVPVIDRTRLILDIFAKRARSREGVLQVELADLEYQRARLVRRWDHLERQRGATGFVGGAGETQIEADRRAIELRIEKLRRRLSKIVRTRALHRDARRRVPFSVVALVGYTNCGKSTLFNRLTASSVRAADMPFATLDPKMRAMQLPSGRTIILSDTVGFISDLPTELVAAFRATLEETASADLILLVENAAHPEADHQLQAVQATLHALGIIDSPPIMRVRNKIDLMTATDKLRLAAHHQPALSALTGEGLATLTRAIDVALRPPQAVERMILSHDEGRCRSWLHRNGVVVTEEHSSRGTEITVRWSPEQKGRFHTFSRMTP